MRVIPAKTISILVLGSLASAACSSNDVGVDDADPALSSIEAITALIENGDYKTWTKEAAITDGPGPHGDKLTYFDPLVAASLEAGNDTHPRGSTLVKELYEGDALRGFAIAIKDRDGADRDAWVWYEVFGTDYANPAFWARGTDSCANCHSGGTDYVLTELPR